MAAAGSAESCDDEVLEPVMEFQEWFNNPGNPAIQTLLFLTESRRMRDGSVRMEMAFSEPSSATFQLICPDGYPHAGDRQFQIRTDVQSLKEWAKQVQSFVTENRGSVKVAGLLTKALELYEQRRGPAAARRPVEEEDDSDFEEEEMATDDDAPSTDDDADCLGDDSQFTTDWEIQMDIRKKRWLENWKEDTARRAREKADMERRAADKRGGGGGASSAGTSFHVDTGMGAYYDFEPLEDYGYGGVGLGPQNAKRQRAAEQAKTIKEGQQIFEHDTAPFQVLCNDMLQLLKEGPAAGFVCDTIDDNVYKWVVKVRGFPADSELAKDLAQLQQFRGYDYIELQLDFVPDFPCYPPLLRVVRPRFKGSIVQSLANIDLLKVTYWNPARPVKDVLQQIRSILERHARLDVQSERNDAAAYPEGAYHPIEDHLIKLALSTEVRPRANWQVLNVDNLDKAPQLKRKHAPDPSSAPPADPDGDVDVDAAMASLPARLLQRAGGTGWAKGTGYGSGRCGYGWNPDEYVKAQQEKDRQILQVLRGIVFDLTAVSALLDPVDLNAIIEGSALIPFLEMELDYPSFIEIARHIEKYRLIVEVLTAMGESAMLLPLLSNLPRQRKCIMAMLHDVSETASQYLMHVDRARAALPSASKGAATAASDSSFEDDDDDDAPPPPVPKEPKHKSKSFGGYLKKKLYVSGKLSLSKKAAASSPPPLPSFDGGASADAAAKADDLERENAAQITKLFERLASRFAENELQYSLGSVEPMDEQEASTSGRDATEAQYLGSLRDLQFGDCTVCKSPRAPGAHYFAKYANEETNAQQVKSIFREWTALRKSLPLDIASSIFVCVDQNQVNLMHAMITGPEKTPYANGCFLFDICFPAKYPASPPLVNSRTNGGGSVRFNPNLYNDGKVCLSLLGTWAGERGESWSAATSTLLQVLISIQSLILIEEPFFNEPGYEHNRGTDTGRKSCDAYNRDVRSNCVKWAIVEQLRNPPPAFKDVVRRHFFYKRERVKAQLDEWCETDGGLKKLAKSAKEELDKLQMGEL